MSLISRLTTWVSLQVLKSSDLNGEFNNIVNLFNNLDSGTSSWTNVLAGTFKLNSQSIAQWLSYRRPRLVYGSGTTVTIETGLNGTSGAALVLFPDGSYRTDSSSSHTTMTISQNAVLSGSKQGGLRTGSVATNTWYAVYAVKATDNTTDFLAVGDTVLPIQANYATLNTNFGTNSWVYLGLIRYGDNGGATGAILSFAMAGNATIFDNSLTGTTGFSLPGTLLATTAGATSLTYSRTSGTGTTDVPNNVIFSLITGCADPGGTGAISLRAGNNPVIMGGTENASNRTLFSAWLMSADGGKILGAASTAKDISLSGFADGALGGGMNPLL